MLSRRSFFVAVPAAVVAAPAVAEAMAAAPVAAPTVTLSVYREGTTDLLMQTQAEINFRWSNKIRVMLNDPCDNRLELNAGPRQS